MSIRGDNALPTEALVYLNDSPRECPDPFALLPHHLYSYYRSPLTTEIVSGSAFERGLEMLGLTAIPGMLLSLRHQTNFKQAIP